MNQVTLTTSTSLSEITDTLILFGDILRCVTYRIKELTQDFSRIADLEMRTKALEELERVYVAIEDLLIEKFNNEVWTEARYEEFLSHIPELSAPLQKWKALVPAQDEAPGPRETAAATGVRQQIAATAPVISSETSIAI